MDNTFGVVCLDAQRIFCTTCKQHSSNCKHVSHLQRVIENTAESDMTTQFRPFAEYKTPAPHQKHAKYGTVVSKRAIPFDLPVDLWKQDDSQRFNLKDGTAYLWPPPSSTCPCCNTPSLNIVVCVQEAFVVTLKCCYPAKGICFLFL